MNKTTNLETIKTVAKSLLRVPVLKTEYSPMIVSHPFTKCGIVTVLNGNDFFQLDITQNEESFNKWVAQMSKFIDEADSVYHIYHMLNDSYCLMFFDSISKYLSEQDSATLLGESWVSSESANVDANVSKNKMLSYFKAANKQLLMSESELESFNDFDDQVVVYRGVSSRNKNHTKALSWTTSFGKADWFAKRWDNGIVYSATIDKQHIFAYFDRKDEDEVVVDFNQLKNIKITTKPLPKPEPTSIEKQ